MHALTNMIALALQSATSDRGGATRIGCRHDTDFVNDEEAIGVCFHRRVVKVLHIHHVQFSFPRWFDFDAISMLAARLTVSHSHSHSHKTVVRIFYTRKYAIRIVK
jgi:hypothetical protein